MARNILLDQFHLGVDAPGGLSGSAQDAIARVLNDVTFQANLVRAVRKLFRRHPNLRQVRLRLSR
jgi:hypothetical protein